MWKLIPVIGVLITISDVFSLYPPGSREENEQVQELQRVLKDVAGHPETFNIDDYPENIKMHLNVLSNIDMFENRQKEKVIMPTEGSDHCLLCKAGAEVLIDAFKLDLSLDFIENVVVEACVLLKIEAEEVCRGMVESWGYQLEYVVQTLGDDATPDLFCGFIVGGDCGDSDDIINGWEVEIPDDPPKPPIIQPVDPPLDVSTYQVLHLTDAHIMLNYLVGSPVDCGLPQCCHNETGMADPGKEAAGYWGSYECDIPFRLFEALLDHLVKEHSGSIDWIIFTGDSPAHNVWLQSKSNNFEHQRMVLDSLSQRFPNIPLYVSLGNHEGFPVNSFPTHHEDGTVVSGKWMYEGQLQLSWTQILDEAAKKQWADQGYFSMSYDENIRIINLNNNFCEGYNFLLMLDLSDPGEHLAWLVEELLASEQRGEKVHLITHHPPSSCIPGWKREWTKIMNRFESTVTGIFLGHVHDDHFEVWHNETGDPSIMSFIGPSLTINNRKNPEYKIYNIASDVNLPGSYGRVIGQETWTSDFSQLETEEDYPTWHKLYDGSDIGVQYGSSSPAAYKEVVEKAMTDDILYEKLVQYYNQDYDKGLPADRRSFLCNFIYNVECNL